MWILHTTPEEKAEIARLGQVPKDEYLYCRPCWGIVTDKEKGAQLIRGMFQVQFRSVGPQAEKMAERLYQHLLSKGTKTRTS
jgi:hypothetical protein